MRFRLGRLGLGLGVGESIWSLERLTAEGTELVPVVATGEYATQAEEEDQQEGGAERES